MVLTRGRGGSQAEEDLLQVMAGALSMLSAAGCDLVGGHTCEGAELALTVRRFCVPAISSSSRFGSALAMGIRAPANHSEVTNGSLGSKHWRQAHITNPPSLSASNVPLLKAEDC